MQVMPFKVIFIFLLHQRKRLVPLLKLNESFCYLSYSVYVLSIFCIPVTHNISIFASQFFLRKIRIFVFCIIKNPDVTK